MYPPACELSVDWRKPAATTAAPVPVVTSQTMPAPRLRELDALRGFAAIAVVLFHLSYLHDKAGLAPFHLSGGHYGVELFFMISGFVIFMSLAGARSLGGFLVSRIARLYPAYWCAALATAAVAYATSSHPPSPAAIIANLTMLQSFVGIPSVDPSYWTLAVEIEFYAGIGMIFAVGLINRIDAIGVGCLLGCHAFKLVAAWRGMAPAFAGDGLDAYAGCFIIGICLFRLRAGQGSWSTYAALLLALLYAAWGGPAPSLSPDGLRYFAITCALALMVWLAVKGHATWLCWPPLLWAGGISYPLYLVHQLIGSVAMSAAHRHGLPGAFELAVASVVALAVAIHRWIETPGRRLLRRRLSGLVAGPFGRPQPGGTA
jgi:peptidoglycan/LPS O-acetylase OafA/YrhL